MCMDVCTEKWASISKIIVFFVWFNALREHIRIPNVHWTHACIHEEGIKMYEVIV